jgi:hypothetical protein
MVKLAFGVAFLLGGTFLSGAANAQCPAIGQDTGCGTIITIDQNGAQIKNNTGQGPYDGSDDTVVGVVNNIPACTSPKSTTTCGISIYSIDLSGPSATNPIFGFDDDGINTFGQTGNAKDTTGYGGPNAYYSNISTDKKSARVNFITPIAPGTSSYFSLESSLGQATGCTNALVNTLNTQTSGANICATFTPSGGRTLAQAAALCGFKTFNWVQKLTRQDDPSAFFARNVGGVFDATVSGPVRLSSKRIPFSDPPQGGGYAQGAGGGANPDNSYPFYYDTATELPGFQNGTKPPACTLTVTPAGNVLAIHDAPSDGCLPGGSLNGRTTCTDPVNAPGLTAEPAGSFRSFVTHVAGVNTDGSATDLGIGFTWKSDYNGSTGGASLLKATAAADNNGTGGATIMSVNQTTTFNGVSISAINGSNNIFAPTSLFAAVLPASRSVTVNGTATAFATIINSGANPATGCSIAPAAGVPLTFHYNTTDPKTNQVTGTLDTPVDISAGASQSFVIALTPTAVINPTDLPFNFVCGNTAPATINTGLNTLLLSASTTATPDVIALGATLQNDGIVHVSGSPASGVFAVATSNLGAGGAITVATNTGSATLPINVTVCQTNPSTGVCLATPTATVSTTINGNATPTFGIFVSASNSVPFDPANSRIFVTFADSTTAVRGETSVAVTTQ